MFITNATENSGRPFLPYEGFENNSRKPTSDLENK